MTMPYRIVMEIDDKEATPADMDRIANYLRETLETMGFSYSMDCYKDKTKIASGMKGSESS